MTPSPVCSGTVAEVERFLAIRATWFELVTAAAFAWFADMAAEAVVVEVGLGGRFDATNVADGDVAVVTNVELDHTQILGPTRESIAGEKSGIIKSGSLLVLGEQDPQVAAIFEAEAERLGARAIWRRGFEFGCSADRLAVGGRLVDLWTPLGRFSDMLVPLHGAYQADNAAAAVAAAQGFLETLSTPRSWQMPLPVSRCLADSRSWVGTRSSFSTGPTTPLALPQRAWPLWRTSPPPGG